MPEHIFEALAADWRKDTRAVADGMRHLMHHGAKPATCGQCQDGLAPVAGCTCGDGLPPYGHEPGCGFEPCPNGCRDVLHPPVPASQTPASQPVNLAAAAAAAKPPKENTMSLASIDDDLREDLTAGITYGKELFARLEAKAPAIISTVDAVGGSTVGQLAEIFLGKILPPDVEAEFLVIAKRYAASFGQPAAPVAPAPVAPAPVQPAAPAPVQ